MLSGKSTDDSRYIDILLYNETNNNPAKSGCYLQIWQRFITWLGLWKKEKTYSGDEERVSIIEELI